MDWAMLIVTALATIAAVASAWVAIIQAKSAKASERDALTARNESRVARDESARLASEANAAFIRQAAAAEKVVALEEAKAKPPVWSGPRWVKGQMYQMINSSGRTVKLEKVEVEPDGTEGLVSVSGQEGGIYELGESFDFVALKASGRRPRRIILSWRYLDELDQPLSRFIIPL